MMTCDVTALFPNVNNSMGIPATAKQLILHPSPHKVPAKCIIEALDIALNNNACRYVTDTETIIAKPNRGTAMGPCHLCDYVDVFMAELDDRLVTSCPVPLLSSSLPPTMCDQFRYLDWSRFRDDGFTVLMDTKHIQRFTECLSELHPPNIQWTVSHGKQINYLDVTLTIKEGKICTDVYSKHNHSYLPPFSCHSPAVYKGFIQGIGTRLRMICSEDSDLQDRVEEYSRYLTISGWDYRTAKRRLQEGTTKNRKKLLQQPRKRKGKKIAWVTTYDPRFPPKSAIIQKNLHLLHANKDNKEIFPRKKIIAADRKRRNLSQIYKPTVPKRFVEHGPKNKPGFYPCTKKCDTCRHSRVTTDFTSPWDGRKWTIRQHLTCTTPNVIYVVRCETHGDLYAGSTEDLKARWRNHKSDMKLKKNKKCGVAAHVCDREHKEDPNFGFITIFAIETVRSEKELTVRENYWQCNLGTIFVGMNNRKELHAALRYKNRVHF